MLIKIPKGIYTGSNYALRQFYQQNLNEEVRCRGTK